MEPCLLVWYNGRGGQSRIFSFPKFDEYAQRQRWTDERLIKIVDDVERGLNDGDLGSNIVKRQVARKGSGSAGGHRVVVVFRIGDRALLVEGFAKNVKEKHTPQQVRALRELAELVLALSDEELTAALESGELREIERNDETDENEEL